MLLAREIHVISVWRQDGYILECKCMAHGTCLASRYHVMHIWQWCDRLPEVTLWACGLGIHLSLGLFVVNKSWKRAEVVYDY